MKKKQQRAYEIKTMPAWVKDVSGRTVTGITAVMGNVDDGGDRILPGAFAKTITENLRRIRHLWQHGADGWDYGVTPPIAAIRSIREVGRDGLPGKVLDVAPDAMGGLEVAREYLATPRGDEILAAYVAGIELEMSIGYNAIQVRYVEQDMQRVSPSHWRDLVEVRLFDTSDVNWGMNMAAIGSKSLERRFEVLVERMKTLREEFPGWEGMSAHPLLTEFRELCLEFGRLSAHNNVDGDAPSKPEQPQPASRAELPTEKISLTPSLKALRELELALIS